MKVWDEFSVQMRSKTKNLGVWARDQARDLGSAGMRQVERQDLSIERRRLIKEVGEQVVLRMIVDERKTVRRDSPELSGLLDRIEQIDERLKTLDQVV